MALKYDRNLSLPSDYSSSEVQSKLTRQSSMHQSFKANQRSLSFIADISDDTDDHFIKFITILIIVSICTLLCDIIKDILLISHHSINSNFWYLTMCLSLPLVSSVIMSIVSANWYWYDLKQLESRRVPKCKCVTRIVFSVLLCSVLLRYIDTLLYAFRTRLQNRSFENKKKYLMNMMSETTDASFLRLYQCFLSGAPILVFQYYLMCKNFENKLTAPSFLPLLVILSSVSISCSIVCHQIAMRLSLTDKSKLDYKAIVINIIYYFFIITARVIALSVFAIQFGYYIMLVLFSHFFLTLTAVMFTDTRVYDEEDSVWDQLADKSFIALMLTFCYINFIDGQTRCCLAYYYGLILTENTVLLWLWYAMRDTDNQLVNCFYCYSPLVTHYVCFFVGIFLLILYYLKFHPRSSDIKVKTWIIREDIAVT